MLPPLLLPLLLSSSLVRAAYRMRLLTRGGAVAAVLVGTLVYAAGGIRWATLLLLFFVTSSLLSRLSRRRVAAGVAAKSEQRDALQVLANGGIPALYALFQVLHPNPLWLVPFAAAVSAATADTWATEVGAWSKRPPINIIGRRAVPPGTSGGVTPLGLAASIAAATALALAAGLLAGVNLIACLGITAGGVTGSLVDSVLGATVQERRTCFVCGATTEQVVHRPCGGRTGVTGGVPGLNNDAVNLLASAAGSVVPLVLGAILGLT